MKLCSITIVLAVAAAWLPASCAARHRIHGTKPKVQFGSMAANLQRAAAQSFLRHRVATEEKEISFYKQQTETEDGQVSELASRLDLEERRTSSLTARVNILEQEKKNTTASFAKLQAQEQAEVSSLTSRMNALEQAKKSETRTRIPTVVHSKVPQSKPVDQTTTSKSTPAGNVNLASKEGLTVGDLMGQIKDAVADIPAQAQANVDSTSAATVPSTWCPEPCDQHHASTDPEVAAKIDQVHAAMAVVSDANIPEDLPSKVSQAHQMMMKSAKDRARNLFSSQPSSSSDEVDTPVASLAAHDTSNANTASLAGSLAAARQADYMLNHFKVPSEELPSVNATQEKQLGEAIDKMSITSLPDDSEEGLEATVAEIVPPEDKGELEKMTTKQQVYKAAEVIRALDAQDKLDNMHEDQNKENDEALEKKDQQTDEAFDEEKKQHLQEKQEGTKEITQESPEDIKNDIIVAAKEQGFTPANDSIVVLPTMDLDEPTPEQVPADAVPAAAESQEVEQLKTIKNMDANAAKDVDAAQTAAKKLDQQLKQTVEELKEVHHVADAKAAAPQDSKPSAAELKMAREAVEYAESEPARQHQQHEKWSKQELERAATYVRLKSGDSEADTKLEKADVADSESQDEEDLKDLSEEGLVSDSDSAGQPSEDEVAELNKMPHDHLVDSPTEDDQEQEAVAQKEDDQEEQDKQPLKASAKELVAAVAKEDDVAKKVRAAQKENDEEPSIEEDEELAQEDKEEAPEPQQDEQQSIRASAQDQLQAAVAKEDDVAQEASAAQKEDDQVDEEEVDRMSKAGLDAANDLEKELSKMDH